MTSELAALFGALDTQDFEIVVRALQHAAIISKIYRPKDADLANQLRTDLDKLKANLIRAVAGRHPPRPNEIIDDRYVSCRTFLSNFISEASDGKVYTMNYDLLLYWALMHEDTAVLDPTPKPQICA